MTPVLPSDSGNYRLTPHQPIKARKRTLPAKAPPQPLVDHPHVLVELREVGSAECDGSAEKYRLRFRQVVVADGLTAELRRDLRDLRRRGFDVPPLLGDELPPEAGATQRGVPSTYDGTDPRLCNAKTRSGRPCRALALPSGRCRWHGGMSTGPRTPEGRARSAQNLVKAREALTAKRTRR